MKMRNIFCLIAALMFAAFAACENPNGGADNGDDDTPHVHQWGEWGPDATCEADVLQTRVCALDESHIEEQVAPRLPHTYGDWEEWEPEGGGIGERIACMVCDTTKDSKLTGGAWLTFTKINNETEYRVSKVSADVPEGIIIIPARYRETGDDEFLPVTQISNGTSNTTANNAFGGNSAANATKIFGVTIPATVTTIAAYAFYNCTSLEDVTIAEGSAVSIGANAFMNCSSLGSIEIPEGVTSIGNTAFRGCTALTVIVIPEGITSIGQQMFYNCSSLADIVFPSSVTSIGGAAFQNCTSLGSVTIPEGITSIGSSAFNGCTGLISIDIPSSVTTIASSVFSGCTDLASIDIPSSVTSIGSGAFNGAGLTSIIIPASVTSIADQAFVNCAKLEVITFLAETPPTLAGQNVFANVYDYMVIKVPAASVQAYKTAQWWKLEADFISAIE